MNKKSIFTRITRNFSKIAVDILDHFCPHDGIQSAWSVSRCFQIGTRSRKTGICGFGFDLGVSD